MLKPPEITSVSLVFWCSDLPHVVCAETPHLALTKDEDVAVLAASVAGAPGTSKPLEGAVHRKKLRKEVSITCVFFPKKKTFRIYYFNFTQLQHKTIAKEKWIDVKWLALRNEPYERCSCKYVSSCIMTSTDAIFSASHLLWSGDSHSWWKLG